MQKVLFVLDKLVRRVCVCAEHQRALHLPSPSFLPHHTYIIHSHTHIRQGHWGYGAAGGRLPLLEVCLETSGHFRILI